MQAEGVIAEWPCVRSTRLPVGPLPPKHERSTLHTMTLPDHTDPKEVRMSITQSSLWGIDWQAERECD